MGRVPTESTQQEPVLAPELTTSFNVRIVPVNSLLGFQAVERLQEQIWGKSPQVVVSVTLLNAIVASGGILLGAYCEDELVGFVLGLVGSGTLGLYHASHMLGIHPGFQGHGIGAALKFRQREMARKQHLRSMTWTFDPLEARNAYFNLHKLGALARVYRQNHYGELNDDLNSGLPSDRLMVEWMLDDMVPHGAESRTADPSVILHDLEGVPDLHLAVPDGVAAVRIEIPSGIQSIKLADRDRALEWRLAVREAFLWALQRGYIATDFLAGGYLLVDSKSIPLGTANAY